MLNWRACSLQFNLNRFNCVDTYAYVGRFINKDPIKLQGGYNLYTYAPNSIMWVDALGLKSEWQKNWEAVHGQILEGYQVHYIISKSTDSLREVNKLCKNFDVHNVNNLIALPKDANVPLKTGADFGKTTNFGYHSGYNEAAIGAMKVAARFKQNAGGCKKLAVVQAALKNNCKQEGKQCMAMYTLMVLMVLKRLDEFAV